MFDETTAPAAALPTLIHYRISREGTPLAGRTTLLRLEPPIMLASVFGVGRDSRATFTPGRQPKDNTVKFMRLFILDKGTVLDDAATLVLHKASLIGREEDLVRIHRALA